MNYANCAVKMAVAPCLNIKYQYKLNDVVVYCITDQNPVVKQGGGGNLG